MKRICIMSALLIACCSFAGCAGVKNSMRLSEKNSQWNPISKLVEAREKKSSTKDSAPESMAVIWKDSVLEKPGTKPVKGFGGRIFFYDENSNAAKADGELIVYGFDDSSKNDKVTPEADRKYVFKSDKFQTHFSETELGGSYSVWIPWEPVGGLRKTITLIPVFKTTDGRVLKSGQSINVLPGRTPPAQSSFAISGVKKRGSGKVAQASFDANGDGKVTTAELEEDDTVYNQTRIKTSTIQVTPTLARRLATPVSADAKQKQKELQNERLQINQLKKELMQKGPEKSSRAQRSVKATSESAARLLAQPGFGQQSSDKTQDGQSESNRAPRGVFGSPGFFGNRK